MSKQQLKAVDRFAELEIREKRIRAACRRSLEETRSIAKDLIYIEDEQLYLEKRDTFRKYVFEVLHLDFRSAVRHMDSERVMHALEVANVPVLPENQNQVEELSRLKQDHQRVDAWKTAVNWAEREDVELTIDVVKGVVELAIERLAVEPKAAKGLDIGIDDGDGDEPVLTLGSSDKPKKAKANKADQPELVLSEKAELALDKIRRICGDVVADALEDGTVNLTENQIIKWADQPDILVRNLAYYIIEEGMSLSKAIDYENEAISDDTAIRHLVLLARARGGTVELIHDDYELKLTLVAS